MKLINPKSNKERLVCSEIFKNKFNDKGLINKKIIKTISKRYGREMKLIFFIVNKTIAKIKRPATITQEIILNTKLKLKACSCFISIPKM
jgi:hypothetical protein